MRHGGTGNQYIFYNHLLYTQSDHTSNTCNFIRGIENSVVSSGTGINTEMHGINTYVLKDGGSTGATTTMYGIKSEVEVDAGTVTNAYSYHAHIDRDGGTLTNGYLYYGNYAGTVGTKWGIYLTGESKNYFSGTLECDGRIYADNGCHVRGDWLRVNGSNGIYFESYGGGWHMTDSTWIRAYNSKPIWVTDHIHVHQADTGVATLSAYGDSQGTGRLYVGQDGSYGGGIEYNGDNSPTSTGAGADYITLYRVNNGTYDWTARNYYSNNDWSFRGQVYAAGAFYTDANRSVIRGGSPTLYFRDTDQMSAMIHNNGNLLYILRGGTDTETWSQVNGQWPWVFNLSNNDSTCGGNLYIKGTDLTMSNAWSPGVYYRIMGYNNAKQIQFSYNDGTWISDNNSIRFGVGGTQGTGGLYNERMRITSGGNVGIGVTSPAHRLDVNGTVYVGNSSILMSGYDQGNSNNIEYSQYVGKQYSGRILAGMEIENVRTNSAGTAIAVNGSYGQKLHFRAHDYGISGGSVGDRAMSIVGNNVGIGTTSPALGFHVNVQYQIAGLTTIGSGIIYNDIATAKWRQRTGGYRLNFERHDSTSVSNYTSWTSRGYLDPNATDARMNFTGQHRTFVNGIPFTEAPNKEGLIVCANNDTYIKMSDGIAYGSNAITINECLPVVSLSQKMHDKSCFGVISLSEDPETREEAAGAFVSIIDKELGDTRIFVNSVGEGGIWVVNTNGTLESGDYITTSNVPGYGMKQDDDLLHNYTVAKITMNCDFNPNLQKVKRIKKKMTNVKYWVYVSNQTVSKEEYDKLQPGYRRIIQDENGYDIYQTNDRTEWTRDPVEENLETFTETRNELLNDLDEYGQLQWEDTDEFETAYKIRYLDTDGNITDEASHVYKAAFVGCTYHCG